MMLTSRLKIIILTAIATLALLSLPSTMLNELQIDATTDCDSSYPDACIPAYPPDLNCGIYLTNVFKFYILTLTASIVMEMV